jgi:hypothetical protein
VAFIHILSSGDYRKVCVNSCNVSFTIPAIFAVICYQTAYYLRITEKYIEENVALCYNPKELSTLALNLKLAEVPSSTNLKLAEEGTFLFHFEHCVGVQFIPRCRSIS